jgi:hypothetical protein
MFTNKQKRGLQMVDEGKALIPGVRNAIKQKMNSRKNLLTSKLLKVIIQLEKLSESIEIEFKKEFLKLYKMGKELNIDIPSGSANANNPNKLVYHWTSVQKGGLFGGYDFKTGYKPPQNISIADNILKQLGSIIKKSSNNKKDKNEVVRKQKEQNNNEKELSELNVIDKKLNVFKSRFQMSGTNEVSPSVGNGIEMKNMTPRLTSNQRDNVYSRTLNVNKLKSRGITNTNINAFRNKKASERQLASIARALNYNLK